MSRLPSGLASDLCVMALFLLPLPHWPIGTRAFLLLQLVVLGFALFRQEGEASLTRRLGRLGWLMLGVVALGPLFYLGLLGWLVFDQAKFSSLPELAFQGILFVAVIWLISVSEAKDRAIAGRLRPLVDLLSHRSATLVVSVTLMPMYFRALGTRFQSAGFHLLDPATWERAFYSGSIFVLLYYVCVR